MGIIGVHEFLALDGVFESPSWTAQFGFDPRMGETIASLTDPDGAILLGRRTFEMFAPAWSTRTAEDDPGAPFFNDTPKYVVTSTLGDAECAQTWARSSSLGGYDPDAIRELKERVDGRIYVSGSGRLVRALLADGLVDELHLFVYPIALGSGDRLFGDPSTGSGTEAKLRLLDSSTYDNGVVHLSYGPS
jgi:dihydrofolate reductase